MSVGRAFQFHLVAVGVMDVNRRANALCPITLLNFSHFNAVASQMRAQRSFIKWRYGQGEMIHITPRIRVRRLRAIQQINQRCAGAQLHQAKLHYPALFCAAQHATVKIKRALHISYPQHHMIDLYKDEGWVWHFQAP